MSSPASDVAKPAESNSVPARPLPPKWLIGLLLFLWLAWICFLIWAGRNDWNTTRPPETPVPLKVTPIE